MNATALFVFKILSGFGLGVFLSVLGQALIGYRYFSFMFVFLTVFFAFFILTRNLQWVGVLMIDLVFLLLVVLMRLYVVMADKGVF